MKTHLSPHPPKIFTESIEEKLKNKLLSQINSKKCKDLATDNLKEKWCVNYLQVINVNPTILYKILSSLY